MPRRAYTMKQRAEALEETRHKILEATMQVHDEQGMADARWEDIAKRAGVSLSTMYRHFSDNEALITACGDLTFQQFPPPDPNDAERMFQGLDGSERIVRLVDEVYGYYEATAPMMELVRRDLHRSAAVRAGFDAIHDGIAALAQAALRSRSRRDRSLASAILDDRTWAGFIDAGMDPQEARKAAIAILTDQEGAEPS